YPHGIGVVADMGGYAGADGFELAAHVALSSSCSVWQKDERRGRPADGHTGPTVRQLLFLLASVGHCRGNGCPAR
ncbi:MAG: hypothetical protein ABSD32_18685, partial [Mycobacterium sp.]